MATTSTPITLPTLSVLPNTPLHLAAYFGDRAQIRRLISNGADIEALGTGNYTALHVAARRDQRGVMTVLLAHLANTDARDISGFTPLHYAAQEGYYRAVQILAVCGGAQVNARNNEGETPLHCAVVADNARVVGAVDAVRVLLANGADRMAVERHGYLAAQLAVGPGSVEIRWLLQ